MPLREIDSGMLEVVMDDQSKPKLNLNLAKHGGWVLRADRIPGIALSTSDLMLLNVRQNLLDPDLRRGDLALVDLAWRVLSQSGIYLVVLGGFAHLRRCIVMPSSKEDSVLVSDNRSQSNVPIGNVTVIGRLIGKLGLEVEW